MDGAISAGLSLASSTLCVGQRVRVASLASNASIVKCRVAAIAAVDEDGTRANVVYEGCGGDYGIAFKADGLTKLASEESDVAASRISALEDFELESHVSVLNTNPVERAKERKGRASLLFKMGDYESAIREYISALEELSGGAPPELSVGCTALASSGSNRCSYRVACVCSFETDTADIIYHNDEEEDGVAISRLVLLPPATLSSIDLQWTLHTNISLCASKIAAFSASIVHASIALALAKHSRTDKRSVARASMEVWAKAYYLRGSAQLSLGRFADARRDASKIFKLKGHAESKPGSKLRKRIERASHIAEKKNRKLVKEISKLISGTTSTQQQQR